MYNLTLVRAPENVKVKGVKEVIKRVRITDKGDEKTLELP